MKLTAHQQDVLNQLIACVESGQKRIILKGSAGVGKTTVARAIVEWFLKNNIFRPINKWVTTSVYITAPTNKALAILQDKMPDNDDRLTFRTIHSALKLRRFIDTKTGEVTFVPEKSGKNPPFEGCKFAILDECSMLSAKLLTDLDEYKFPIVFLGDDKQLNPVKEPVSPVFHRGYPTFELTEIVRQGRDNPIIELSRNLSMLNTRVPKLTDDGRGYMYEESKHTIVEKLAEVNGTDEMKFLAWDNFNVNNVNSAVRRRIYGNNPAKVEPLETLVFNAPFEDIYTNKEVKVEELAIVTENIQVPTNYTRFEGGGIAVNTDNIKMKVYRVNNQFNIVHEHSEAMFKILLDTIKSNCSKYGWNWRSKFFFEEQFADVKYNHAITIHKSQGSTYGDTILNIKSIMHNSNVDERNRLLYTGVTRAANLLILNNS